MWRMQVAADAAAASGTSGEPSRVGRRGEGFRASL